MVRPLTELFLLLPPPHTYIMAGARVVQCGFGHLRRYAYARGPGQLHRRSDSRRRALRGYVDWALTTLTQRFIWNMASPLSTGYAPLFLLLRVLTPFKCIIWIVLAGLAEVPPMVCLFLSFDITVFTSTTLRSF
jgi:hypothetical protein